MNELGESEQSRGNLSLEASQMQAIDEVLMRLMDSAPAELVLLVDAAGLHISHAGKLANLDVVALGSLVAGDVAASQQIARMIGDYDEAAVLLREGLSRNVLVSEAGPQMILMMLTNKQVPIGWSRLNMFRAVRRLEEISRRTPTASESRPAILENLNLGDAISEAVGRLWSD